MVAGLKARRVLRTSVGSLRFGKKKKKKSTTYSNVSGKDLNIATKRMGGGEGEG